MNQKYEKLKALLKELFQLDQPDLDFGIYRVMHAKSAEVTQFLDDGLLPQVQAAFALYKTADKADIEKELAKLIAGIEAAGMNPEESPKVLELRARLKTEAVDIGALESEVYDHLHSFFRRYYSEGDFLSKRVYKAGVYAIPYEGEEVKLHWANADQYYIKTSEYLRDYAFRLRPDSAKNPMRVHFRLVDVAEGEHGNVKAAEGKDRLFILAAGGDTGRDFIAEEDGEQGKELVIRFEYRPATLTDWPADVRQGKTKPPAQRDLTVFAAKSVLAVTGTSLSSWIAELGTPHRLASGEQVEYTRLEAHLRRYAARNTFDYFIHKDLGGFLRRELDFYIKNEVMHLDDVENETVSRVEQYISKIKVIRKIAGKIIDFLAQLEDFQKKLWLKKKFVVETSWCIRVGCIPEEFHAEIVANNTQREEWVRLLAIEEIASDLTTNGYSVPLTPEFLKAHPTLVVDTRYFDPWFSARLLDALGDVDVQTDGVLFHSENFQALSVMQLRYRDQVKCIYIDPPYNTGNDGFAYKDTYQHSSWLSMIDARLAAGAATLCRSGIICVSIGEDEQSSLRELMLRSPLLGTHAGTVVWKARVKPVNIGEAKHRPQKEVEYVHVFERRGGSCLFRPLVTGSERTYPCEINGRRYRLATILKSNRGANRRDTMRFEIGGYEPPEDQRWQGGEDFIRELFDGGNIEFRDGTPFRRYFEDEEGAEHDPFYCFMEGDWSGTSEIGKSELNHLLGNQHGIDTVKPTRLVSTFLLSSTDQSEIALDYFAGSGTTGHAVINLNRQDGGKRKFILIEMGDYFDTVLLPRIKKITFTPEWKDGKPKRFATQEEADRSPRIVKVIRLESYEDALNNLDMRRTKKQDDLLEMAAAEGADGLREQYILRYMLDVETRGSQSLLNVQAFTDPTAYKLKVKRPGSDESREVNVDLLETFNWLIGLTVRHIAAPQSFAAAFERDSENRLRLKGRIKLTDDGPWWFRSVTGATPDGRKTLVIWRNLTTDPEQDNLVLDAWFTKQGYSSKDSEFDLIYVNGGNNLENLKAPDDTWKVRLIEEDFHRLMFEAEGV